MSFLLKKTPLTRTIFFASADIFFTGLAVWLAFLLRFDGNIPPQYVPFIFRMIALAVIFLIPIFYFNKLYSFSWSYVSASELISLFKAITISFIFLSVAIFISKYFPNFTNFPRSVIFISYILIFVFSGGIRLSKRIFFRILGSDRTVKKQRTLIAGAGDAGEQILRSIISADNSPYYPIGFVDDSRMKQGVSIHGLRVLGKISDIPKVAADKGVKQLIIALPSAANSVIKNAVELGRKAGIWRIKIVPPLAEIVRGKVSLRNLKTVQVGDLLGREPAPIDIKQIDNFIKNKTILITGAAGSIGSELSRQAVKFNPGLILLLDQDETGIFNIGKELKEDFSFLDVRSFVADIRDKESISKIFSEFRPQIIFHAAAYKHVPLMEQNPDEAIKNNIFGTQVLADSCVDCGAESFIQISTDKAVNPTSVMGATKRICEMICQANSQKNNTKFISVRFGNVLDSRGSVIPTFREQIKKRGPVTVTDPRMERYFMLIPEACLLVMQASAMGQGGEVFVLDMGKPIKILDLAKEMIRLSGFEPDKDIAITFAGIRPGEKLFEEILTTSENASLTKNKKIFIARLKDISDDKFEDMVSNLEKDLHEKEMADLAKMLEDIVSFYH